MNTKKIVFLFLLFISTLFTVNAQKEEGLFAELQTPKGKILLQLEFEKLLDVGNT